MHLLFSKNLKNRIRDSTERKFNKLHHLADKLPLAPLDGLLHGSARGISNWLLDVHPKGSKATPSNQKIIIPEGEYKGTHLPISCVNFLQWFAKFLQENKSNYSHEELDKLSSLLRELKTKKLVTADDLAKTYLNLKIDLDSSVLSLEQNLTAHLESLGIAVESIKSDTTTIRKNTNSLIATTSRTQTSVENLQKTVDKQSQVLNNLEKRINSLSKSLGEK